MPKTILLVDDDPLVLELLEEVLTTKGYKVLPARDWAEAVQIAEPRRQQIDLLLTDVVMPAVNGRQLAQCLMQLHPEMKVLYMSGYAEDPVVRHFAASTVHFLEKPFPKRVLLEKVRQLMG